ncbi:uncharacterized protein LAESUDRAFT_339231 [Laetiporus sulphureus 93-53]|uniref:DUF218 domain-containing protein n=1 Tax=Laetiporus sulphureus 93-53 TaxID=1314785 RepID=A0A165GND0_9APHY|nr:uncharacterized protein LAESUDRAFT_339231 [Laetiporus sulphureus 93-53]KZT10585.1 hypothetical protein LAESUDRAFT_339231 [Laetiporus sulphureus 93-53]
MLPLPVVVPAKRRLSGTSVRRHRDVLLARARITNLGLLLLGGFTALSLLLNLRYYLFPAPGATWHRPRHPRPPFSLLATVPHSDALSLLNHLIIVPCHGVWQGHDPLKRLDEDDWILEDYQRGGGWVSALNGHIVTAVELATADEKSLLVFSGGQTRPMSTSTEAESYLRLAFAAGMLPTSSDVSSNLLRATTEQYALDSFQNLLFSIARFHEYTGRYPEKITVVGHEIKRQRFFELHRAAMRWSRSRFHYVGIDAEGEEGLKAYEGEKLNGYLPYSVDIYGCHDFLLSKRRSRNPFKRFHSYYTSSPELASLFDWCPDTADGGRAALFHGPLPWDYLRPSIMDAGS